MTNKTHIYGIQGGPGSFNEEAVLHYFKKNNISDAKIVYLHTSENVMKALEAGEIDRGQIAIHNGLGGIVDESIQALAQHLCSVSEKFAIRIAHALMIRTDADFSEVTTIMTHPQVLAQCKNNLTQKYPHLIQTSGEGELIDHALVAQYLNEGKLPKQIAVMGSKRLAEIYGLQVVEENLQDEAENLTTFLHLASQAAFSSSSPQTSLRI